MPGTKPVRWAQLDHSREPLYEVVAGQRSSRSLGPIAEFLAKKAAERAPKTHAWYKESLTQLWTFLEAQELTLVGDFDEHSVNLFRMHLKERGVSDNTVANRLRAIKAFSRWMAAKGWTDGNLLADLRAPQSTKPQFDLIPDDLRRRLFDLYPPDTFLGSRNLAILGVLSDTGLRREEVANLLLANLDLEGGVLKVFSDKTEEWRWLPLTHEVSELLQNHLTWRKRYFATTARHRLNGSDDHRLQKVRIVHDEAKVFLTWDGRGMAPQQVTQLLFRASKKLGVRVHPHLFRHDWITRKALDGESPSLVKRWAGHKSYLMTDYYFGIAEQMLGAIKPKHSVLSTLVMPAIRRKGRPSNGRS